MSPRRSMALRALLAATLVATTAGAGTPPAGEAVSYSPPARGDIPRRVFWGDTHLHTNNSPDAFTFANTSLGAETAYRFARGERVRSQFGLPVQLRAPLDFLVVADHAEFLGIFRLLEAEDPAFLATPLGRRWHAAVKAGEHQRVLDDFVTAIRGDPFDEAVAPGIAFSVWQGAVAAADRFNEPGRFTALAGYEWTSMPSGNNLHRVVVFADGAERTGRITPLSAIDSADPEALWAWLARYESETGGRALAIPHNGNVSNGLMFAPRRLDGSPIDRSWAETRARWEPVVEVTQMKGDAETHPFLSPSDEFADFETWDLGNIDASAAKENAMLRYEYARSALGLGLELEAESALGANPFRFGMIGSTDSHTSLATADEDNFFGKFPLERPMPTRMTERRGRFYANWRLGASGYAAAWAEENTREAIFSALARREVYASTGPRITLRLFAGWDFEAPDATRSDFAEHGYARGVPMGAELPPRIGVGAPRIVFRALKDPDGANLDRLQVVKGWLDGQGRAKERVFDVALSDGRVVDPATGRAPPVGDTVDREAATWNDAIGAAAFTGAWVDPAFDPASPAFYYLRVLEIPTPRWTAYDRARFGLEEVPEGVPMTLQERAYSSPVWYTPR